MNNEAENIFSVTEVNRHLKNVIEGNIPNLLVEGEIANFTHHRSGHIYFSLKDENSSIRCVFFKFANKLLNFSPKEGDKVVCTAKITVYEKGGNYQHNVSKMLPAGIGELQFRFEELKKKLVSEGLFDEIYKKQIPKFPEKIGVITSATGAAIQDIKNVISRRFPAKIFLYSTVVQGEKAAQKIVAGIEYFNQKFPVDTLIIGRGGGSQEDLFCFNDEDLARSIFASKIPIISAVGHEIDFTISDFVADLRAPTPSAAAELAVPDKNEILQNIDTQMNVMNSAIKHFFFSKKIEIQELENCLIAFHPKNVLLNFQQRLQMATVRLANVSQKRIEFLKKQVEILSNELRELSPHAALKRGYSLLRQEKKMINSVAQISENEKLEVILSDGKCETIVKKVTQNENSL